MKKKGFTLVELLVVIALIAGISIVAITSLTGIADKRKKEEWEQEKRTIETAKLIHSLENISCGISSGAALRGAIDYIKSNGIHDAKIVVIFPDSGNRYSW